MGLRGGSTGAAAEADDEQDEDEEESARLEKDRIALQRWRLEQQQLLQLRSTFLSEALADRGVPLTTMAQVSTLESDRPAETVDWDCAVSTDANPKSCLYSFDAQAGTKVIAPLGTTQYITLTALNRLRRTDPTKVEPMWHGKYAVLRSWFMDDNSVYSLLQHVGMKGFFVSTVLLDAGNGIVLTGLLGIVTAIVTVGLGLPVVEYLLNRIVVSGLFWSHYNRWSTIYHAAFPLKLLLGQMAYKFVAAKFNGLVESVRNHVVELECQILEDCVPVTVFEEEGDDVEEESVVDEEESEDY